MPAPPAAASDAPAARHIAALPARQRIVAKGHRQHGADRGGQRLGQPFRHLAAGGGIDRAQLAQNLDHGDLLGRRAADQAAIVMERQADRAGQAGLARFEPRRAALNDQSGGDHAAPGGDAGQAGKGLVRGPLEMARAAGERVEQAGAVDRVGARQDVGRIGGPEEDAAAPQIGAPGGLADLLAMGGKPGAGDPLGPLGAALARRRGRKVAQPCEAVQIEGEILGQADRREIHPLDRDFGAVVG